MSQDFDMRQTLIDVTKKVNDLSGRVAALSVFVSSIPGAETVDIKRIEKELEKITPKTIREPTGMSNALGMARHTLLMLTGFSQRLTKPEVR